MNLHTINIIIRREYLNKVKKKSFLILTFLGPIFFAAITMLPSLIMFGAKEQAKNIAVVDKSAIAFQYLKSNETVEFKDYSGQDLETLKTELDSLGLDAVLYISPLDSVSRSVSVVSYAKKPLSVEMNEKIENNLSEAVEAYRVRSYDIQGLDKIMDDVKADVKVVSYTVDESGKEKLSASEVYMFLSMFLAMVIYMFVVMFSGMVMSSVIEEKSSRVVEVLVSSVKSTELMFGKIIGVALVALTQFFLWVVLTIVIVTVASNIFGFGKLSEMAAAGSADQMTQMMGMPQQGTGSAMDLTSVLGGSETTDSLAEAVPADSLANASADSEMVAVISTLSQLNYVEIILAFILYFIFGYLLYASLFAAIGSAVENEADTQQLSLPITIPMLIGFFIAFYAFKAPESGIVFWGSMIPFTSPIVMLARIPFGVPAWELVLSLVLLVLTFVLMAWISAKIYKVGILMFGKKTTFKDLWKWLKQK